jgi:chitinase
MFNRKNQGVASSTAKTSVSAWAVGVNYSVGDIVTYDGSYYECLQAHTSQADWTPPATPALWELTTAPSNSVPAVPTGLTATAASETQINVSWTSSTGATGYDLEIDSTTVSDVTSPYSNTGLSAGSTHTYSVRAKNSVGDSAWSTSVSATTSSSPSTSTWGSEVFAPYVDVMAWPTLSISNTYTSTGQKYYTLAFITSDSTSQGVPAWGGITALSEKFYMDEITAIRSDGGDVIISFGGASGTEIALNDIDATTLQAHYQEVIDTYSVTWIDFDIEGSAVADKTSVDKRNKAIKGLKAANSGLIVSYTLPVLPSGLTSDGLYVLTSAVSNGASIDVVNVMAMDYGDSEAPNPSGQMGTYAIEAAKSTYNQCVSAGLSTKIGVTPMLGVNDTSDEIFYTSDAQTLLAWAQETSWVRLLAMWSVNRDNSKSGITQTDFAFTDIFKAF